MALDLGKNKTVGYVLERDQQVQRHTTARISLTTLHDLIVAVAPDRVMFEICPMSDAVHDVSLGRNVRTKSDRLDAVKLMELSLIDQLSLVHDPNNVTRHGCR